MAIGDHESIPIRPLRIAGVVFEMAGPQSQRHFRHAHGHAGDGQNWPFAQHPWTRPELHWPFESTAGEVAGGKLHEEAFRV